MAPSELYQQLQGTYNLVCFVDMADISNSPEEIFKLLSVHYKSEYKENERLVFYTNNPPSNELLAHIQKAAFLIDISNWFILICCPTDLSDQLTLVDNIYGSGHGPIQQLISECTANKLNKNYFVPDTICPLPFAHLEINHQGAARPCCVYKNQVGQVPGQQIKEIFYSNEMAELRKDFIEGKQPSG
jgi:hypothetical protein